MGTDRSITARPQRVTLRSRAPGRPRVEFLGRQHGHMNSRTFRSLAVAFWSEIEALRGGIAILQPGLVSCAPPSASL